MSSFCVVQSFHSHVAEVAPGDTMRDGVVIHTRSDVREMAYHLTLVYGTNSLHVMSRERVICTADSLFYASAQCSHARGYSGRWKLRRIWIMT